MVNLKHKIQSQLNSLRFKLSNRTPQVFYSKKWIAPQIFKAPPIQITGNSDSEIHVLVSKRDFLAMLWSLYSFYIHSPNDIGLVVHDDGSLEEVHRKQLEKLFPGAITIYRSESDSLMEKHLMNFPNCSHFRKGHPTNLKVLDFSCLSNRNKIIFFDSDILFFKKPNSVLLEHEYNVFLEDVWTNYCLPIEELKDIFSIIVPPKINIGFGKIERKCFDLSFIENALSEEKIRNASYIADQTLIAVLAARSGVKTLGGCYKMTLASGIEDQVVKHYTNIIRHRLYTEGIPFIYKKIFN